MAPMTPALIDPVRLKPLLGGLASRFDVDALAEGSSSNDLLMARTSEGAGASSGSVLVVDRQTAGRGRRGRSWASSPDSSLTFSLLWRFEGGVERLAGLSLAVGVALVRAVSAFGVSGAALKWPNDILLNGGKLAGILVELTSARRRMGSVFRIGINLSLPSPSIWPRQRQIWVWTCRHLLSRMHCLRCPSAMPCWRRFSVSWPPHSINSRKPGLSHSAANGRACMPGRIRQFPCCATGRSKWPAFAAVRMLTVRCWSKLPRALRAASRATFPCARFVHDRCHRRRQ